MATNSIPHWPVVCMEHQLPSALMYYLLTSLAPDTITQLRVARHFLFMISQVKETCEMIRRSSRQLELDSYWAVNFSENKESKNTKDLESILISLSQVVNVLVLAGKRNVTIKWEFHSCGISDLTEQISFFLRNQLTMKSKGITDEVRDTKASFAYPQAKTKSAGNMDQRHLIFIFFSCFALDSDCPCGKILYYSKLCD